MASDYFLTALDRYRIARAAELGCTPEDFDAHSLVIAERPSAAGERFALMAVTFGTGTVVSVAPVVCAPTVDPMPEPPVVNAASPPSTQMTRTNPPPLSGNVQVIAPRHCCCACCERR